MTAASRERVETLVDQMRARIWIEHDVLGYTRLRKAPAYYD
jgi:hypothetical protein